MWSPLLALALAAAPPAPFTAGPSVEGISEYRLPNGLQVLLIPDPSSANVAVNLTVFVGSRHEGYGERGMAHLFEHMLFKRTRRIRSVKEELSRLGGEANGTTWFDRTNFFEVFPASDANVESAVALEAERLRHAVVSREELAAEMTVVRNELEIGENDPDEVTEQRLLSAAFLWHNYGNSTIGPRSDIEQVPTGRLLAWYETWYQPDNALLVVAGRFDERRLLRAVAKHFGRIPRPRRKLPETYTREPTQDGENSVTVRRAGGVPLLYAAYHVPAATDPDFAAIQVASALLGATPGGRLHRGLVEPRLAAGVQCTAYALREPGALVCSTRLDAGGATAAAAQPFLTALESPGELSDQELVRARQAVLRTYEDVLNDSTRTAIEISEYAALGDWRMLFLLRDRVAAVTRGDLTRVLTRYLKPSNRTLAEYVPTDAPARAEIPPPTGAAVALHGYAGRPAPEAGEGFAATPEALESRTSRWALSNGGKVALLPRRTRGQVVHGVLRLPYGDERSLVGFSTAAEATAALLLRGTTRLTRQEVADLLDAWGATLQAEASGQALELTLEVRRPHLQQLLALLAECLQHPALDPTQLEELRRERLASLAQAKDNPGRLGSQELLRRLQPFSPGHPLYLGSFDEQIATWQGLTAAQVRAFHAGFYGAQALRLALVGDFDPAALRGQLEAQLGTWTAQHPWTRIPVPLGTPRQGPQVLHTPDKAMAFLGTALGLPLRDTHPDHPALLMANQLVGGGFMQGRLPARLREREGLSYAVGTFYSANPHDDAAAWMGFATFAPDNATRVLQGFREEIGRAVEGGFTPGEFQRARDGLLQERATARAQGAWVADSLASGLAVDRTFAHEAALDAALRALTVDQVNAALKRHVDPTRLLYLQAGNLLIQ